MCLSVVEKRVGSFSMWLVSVPATILPEFPLEGGQPTSAPPHPTHWPVVSSHGCGQGLAVGGVATVASV